MKLVIIVEVKEKEVADSVVEALKMDLDSYFKGKAELIYDVIGE